jgi:hypothetical protein
MPEIGIALPLREVYENAGLAEAAQNGAAL